MGKFWNDKIKEIEPYTPENSQKIKNILNLIQMKILISHQQKL